MKLTLLFITSRPVLWIVFPLVFLAGFTVSGASWNWQMILQLVLLTLPWNLFVYGINDVYDYESDKRNGRKGGLEGPKLKPKYHCFILKSCLLVLIVMIISSLLAQNIANLIGLAIMVFFTYFYSAPPVRLKVLPPLDSISNGFIYILGPALLGFSFGAPLAAFPKEVFFVAIGGMGFHAYTTILDYKADKAAGDKTFAVVYGKRLAALFTLIMMLLILVFSGITIPMIIYYTIGVGVTALITIFFPNEKLAKLFAVSIFFGFIVVALLFLT